MPLGTTQCTREVSFKSSRATTAFVLPSYPVGTGILYLLFYELDACFKVCRIISNIENNYKRIIKYKSEKIHNLLEARRGTLWSNLYNPITKLD